MCLYIYIYNFLDFMRRFWRERKEKGGMERKDCV